MMTQQIYLLHFESYSARKLFDDKTLLTMTVVLYHYYKRHGHYIFIEVRIAYLVITDIEI